MRYRMFRNITAALVLIAACGSPRGAPVSAQSAQYQTGTLDQMLAPIALYPDQLLAQILMSAADPAKVTELDKWMKSNAQLKGTALQDGAVKAGFEASFVALVVFPQVVAKMAEQIAWTTLLGQAFTKDRSAVFDTIQKLRTQARNVGTLKDTPQQNVEMKTTSAGQEVIVIEPANPQVIYVPQYNTEVVYTQAPSTTTVVVQEDNSSDAIAAGLIGFTAGIAIGAASNNYYYGPCCMYGGAYMYNDAWDDYYDHREDAREDWADHREDLSEERTDRRENTSEQRTQRQENRQENRPESAQRAQQAQQQRQASGQSATTQRANRTGSAEARGYGSGSGSQAAAQRSTRSSDAFSGYSSGSSQRAASSRGQASRSGGGGGGRSRSGGGRRR
jgi:uncharacterized membrane protein YgcG